MFKRVVVDVVVQMMRNSQILVSCQRESKLCWLLDPLNNYNIIDPNIQRSGHLFAYEWRVLFAFVLV